MNIAMKSPLGIKAKSGKNPVYLAAIHTLPCCICQAFGEVQTTPTEAHHTFCGRYSMAKTPDMQAIPLCDGHHQGKFEAGKLAIHQSKAAWVEKYGPDTDYIAATQDALENPHV